MDEDIFGTDLMLRVESRQEYLGLGADLMVGRKGDLEKVSGRGNLGQALLHRLLTRRGELATLGHPEYGSRLHELIGEPNNENTRDLVRLYAKECILQDPRVKDIVAIKASIRDDPSAVSLDITVLPVKSSVPMNLVFPFFLEVG